ncbi:MAG: right-handed parallel beta-helix repeat-containing protein [Armatimonadetes bacterium]|nr:right-handed parallel beta-helix repeat-containing protein [Armatimonadota bacterium]
MLPRIVTFIALAELPAALWCAAAAQEPSAVGPTGSPPLAAAGRARLATDYASEASVTAGIQEAINSLPEGGGTVYVPEGVYEIRAAIRLRPNTVLTGAGRNSILRKGPGWYLPLAEDVKKGADQGYVVVQDASGLRPGMGAVVSDTAEMNGDVLIDRVEGNKVFLKAWNIHGLQVTPWRPSRDSLVSRKAALYSGHAVIRDSTACVISYLALDGNKEAQKIGGQPLYKEYPFWENRLRCAPYMGGYSRLENCWVYDAVGVCISLGWTATVSHCDIWGGFQGIHAGAGPNSKVIANEIHDHQHLGIMLCQGNWGLVISQNHIHDCGVGIGGLGDREYKVSRGGDHFCIISQNVVYRNRGNGIAGGHSVLGPTDFIVTENLVINNCTTRGRPLRSAQAHLSSDSNMAPAGICFFNAQRCVIANNRVMDDQDFYRPSLAADAKSGDVVLNIARDLQAGMHAHPMHYERWAGFPVRVSDGEKSERCLVQRIAGGGGSLELAAPLAFDYPKGALVTPEKTQLWGILVTGPRSEDNVIANNVCVTNGVGGILWDGKNLAISANVGLTVAMDAEKSLEENVYPTVARVALGGPGFEGKSDWSLGPSTSLDAPGHSGKRSLKIVKRAEAGVAEAVSGAVALEPNTRYRLSAWVRTSARRGDQAALPTLTLAGVEGESLVGAVQPALRSDFEKVAIEPGQWIRVTGEGLAGPRGGKAAVRCRLDEGVVGEAWVDDIAVEKLGG